MKLGLSLSLAGRQPRGASGPPPWTPAPLFAASGAGLWHDPSDLSTLSQDSAGTTPVTTVGQTVRRIADKSGNANHLLPQSGSDAIGVLAQDAGGRYYIQTDGSTNGGMTGAMALGTGWECFMAVRRDDADQIVLAYGDVGGSQYFGVAQSGSSGVPSDGSGDPVYLVDGVSVAATRGDLDSALSVGAAHVFEARNLTIQAWSAFGWGMYFSTFAVTGRFYGVLARPAMDADQRAALRTWMGAKSGLTL
jgi:hypothetical protein